MAMDVSSELAQIATRLEDLARRGHHAAIAEPLDRLQKAAEAAGKSASGSWLGYHAYIYYGRVEVPPPGAHFDRTWGLLEGTVSNRTSGDWVEHKPEDIVEVIRRRAGSPDLALAHTFHEEAREEIAKCKSTLLSIIQVHLTHNDPYLESIKERINNAPAARQSDVIETLAPSGSFIIRDELAASQGRVTPPHLTVLAEVYAIKINRETVDQLIKVVNDIQVHLSRQSSSVSRPLLAISSLVTVVAPRGLSSKTSSRVDLTCRRTSSTECQWPGYTTRSASCRC